jgi:hypothetical protein
MLRVLCQGFEQHSVLHGELSIDGRELVWVGSDLGQTAVPADLNHVRWVYHCRDLVQIPVVA